MQDKHVATTTTTKHVVRYRDEKLVAHRIAQRTTCRFQSRRASDRRRQARQYSLRQREHIQIIQPLMRTCVAAKDKQFLNSIWSCRICMKQNRGMRRPSDRNVVTQGRMATSSAACSWIVALVTLDKVPNARADVINEELVLTQSTPPPTKKHQMARCHEIERCG